MRDVEELLRETLTDPRHKLEPGPGMYEGVRGRVRERRHRQLAIVSASIAVVAVAAIGSVVGMQASSRHRTTPTNIPTPSGSPVHGVLGTAIDIGTKSLQVADAVATTDALYILAADPNKVVLLSPTGAHVKATADGPAGAPSGIVVANGVVWAWSQNTGELRAYDAKTLSQFAVFETGLQIFNVVGADGEIYLSTADGLYHSTSKASDGKPLATPSKLDVPGLTGGTYGLAADPARHQVFVGVIPLGSPPQNGFAGVRVVAIDTRTNKVTAQSAPTAVGKESIAVVGDQVWVGGYGDVDKPRLLHFDAKTLKVIGSSPVGSEVGPGAIVWPGSNVVWVRDGGSEGLSCLDPKTGAVLEQWDTVQGPVTSVGGSAFGVEYGLQPLTLAGACTG